MKEKIVILDFGSQYTQLIARRVREIGTYSEILPYWTKPEDLGENVKGIILSGGPSSVYDGNAPLPSREIFDMGLPVLGVCYGLQVIAYLFGGKVEPAESREYGFQRLKILKKDSALLKGVRDGSTVWMSHGDVVRELPEGFVVSGATDNSPFAVIENPEKRIFGVQFHPEVAHTEDGLSLLGNFVRKICGTSGSWNLEDFLSQKVNEIREEVGSSKVLLALSGGVDSSVVAYLLDRAIGNNYYPIFVDTGLLKKGEKERILKYFGHNPNLRIVDASSQFFDALKGIEDPEKKRKTIGRKFIDVFESEARNIGIKFEFLAQGTLYPDVIESTSVVGPSEVIKSHHNVGGLPERLHLKLIEPLRELFKDEVRKLGKLLNVPDEVLKRHPFPGPGMAVRIIGEVSPEKVKIIQDADYIVESIIKKHGLYDEIWQVFPVLLPVKTVGVKGDKRSYENVIAIRAVASVDGMTADWYRMPYEVLAEISTSILNNVDGLNRVVYDISTKPPATIEWE
ncbi:MAG: glutamine-hydrolyzing GMP synthase [bacterium]|nr:glutamine-hydrolyzing GMP synthase [bacterium]